MANGLLSKYFLTIQYQVKFAPLGVRKRDGTGMKKFTPPIKRDLVLKAIYGRSCIAFMLDSTGENLTHWRKSPSISIPKVFRNRNLVATTFHITRFLTLYLFILFHIQYSALQLLEC